MKTRKFVLFAAVAASGCKSPSPAPVAAVRAADSALTPQSPSAPARGRSQFDDLIAGIGGKVPFPIKKLRDVFTATYRLRAQTAFFAYSRSLQQEFVSPAQPRIVLAITGGGHDTTFDKELRFPDIPMFVAYSEKAAQLEVISYNDQLARYEFQIVSGYAPGATPTVSYANRKLCAQCHQGETPLFPRQTNGNLWEETNAGGSAFAAMKKAIGAASYKGLKLSLASFNSMLVVDDAAARGADHQVARNLLAACGAAEAGAACRRALIADRLVRSFASFTKTEAMSGLEFRDTPTYQQTLRTIVDDAVGAKGLPTPTSRLAPRDPDPAAPYQMTPAENPKTLRKPEILKRGAISGKIASSLLARGIPFATEDLRFLNEWSGRDFAKIQQLLAAPAVAATFAAEPFSLVDFQQALAQEVTGHAVARRCCHKDEAEATAPIAAETPAPSDDSALGLFTTYCAECHTGNGDAALDFMEDSANIRGNATIKTRLDWDATPADEQMPPTYSGPGKALRARPAHLEKMRAYLKAQ